MLYYGLTSVTEEVASKIVSIVKRPQEPPILKMSIDNLSSIPSIRHRGAVMNSRYNDIKIYYACREEPTQPGCLTCLICSTEKGRVYSFKGGPAAGKKHFNRCHQNIAAMYPMTDEKSRREREMALRYLIDETNQNQRYTQLTASEYDPVGDCLCDAILSHGIAYSQGPVLKQLLIKIISAVAKFEGYTAEIQRKLLGLVSIARVSRSTIQRRGVKQYALHKELVHRMVKEASVYSILLGTVSSGKDLRLFVAVNCLWSGDGPIQTIIYGLPALPPQPTSTNILNGLFQSMGACDSLVDVVQQHRDFLRKLIWISVCEDSNLRYSEIKQALASMTQDVAEGTLIPVSKTTSVTQISFLRHILNTHNCDILNVITTILEKLGSILIDRNYSNTTGESNYIDDPSGRDIKEWFAWDKIDHLVTRFSKAESQLDRFSLTDFKAVIEFILENKYSLVYSILNNGEPGASLRQSIANILESQWLQRVHFIEDLVTLLCPLESALNAPNACVLDMYTQLVELHSTLRDACNVLPYTIPDLSPNYQKCIKELSSRCIIPDEATFYMSILSDYIDEISATLDCYSPYISCFKLCSLKLSSITLDEIVDSLSNIPCKIHNLTETANEYYSIYQSQKKVDRDTNTSNLLQNINQQKNMYECWKEYTEFWSGLQDEYPLASRCMLTLLTIFATPAIFRASENLISNTLSAHRFCLTETNSEAAILLHLTAQLHGISKSIYFEFISATSIHLEMDPSRRLRHFRSEIPQPVTEHRSPKRVEKLVFSVLSSSALMKLSEVQITTPILYEHYPSPANNGVLDKRLGLSDKVGKCATCGKDTKMCIGHFGTIALALPVFHPGLINDARTMLSVVCPFCSRVKISETDRLKYKVLTHKFSLAVAREAQEQAKKQVNCPFCHAPSTICKKSQGFRVMREMHYEESASKILADVIKHQKDVEKIHDLDQRLRNHVVDPIQALHILQKVPECDYPYLGIPWQSMNVYASQQTPSSIASNDVGQLFSRGSSKLLARTASRFVAQHQGTNEQTTRLKSQSFLTRPQDVVLTHVPVPPSCLRPSVQSGSGAGTTEDNLTSHLVRILTVNDKLKEAMASGAVTTSKVYAKWDQLSMDVSLLYIGKIPGGAQPAKGKTESGTKEGTGIIDRLKGKAGRFRSNLSGKRVNFSGRTVISPNPYLSMQQVAIPRLIAQNLTFPEIVTSRNIRFLRELILNGKTYPGANEVLLLNDTIRYNPALKRLGIDMKRSRDMEAKAMELVSRCVDTFNLNSLCADLPELQAAIQHLVSESSNAINSELKEEDLPQEQLLFARDVPEPIHEDDSDSTPNDIKEETEPKLENVDGTVAGEPIDQLQNSAAEPQSESKTILKLNSIASLQLTNASSQHLSTFKLNTVSLLQKDRRGRQAIANSLRPNDIVYRHLLPNDTLLFNRQPSLHRMSIMQFNAVIHENRTFSFNPVVCSPFNADFDGDEMNIFYMQGQEARAEAGILMGSHENIISPRHGECMIGLTQDFLTGIYILSGKGIFMTRHDYCQHVSYGCDGFGDATYGVSLYNYGREFIKSIHGRRGTAEDTVGFVKMPCLSQPCIVYPRQLYSGKQVLSVLLKGNDFDSVNINLEHGDKTYKKDDNKRALSVNDDYTIIQNSEHLAGRLTKTFLASSKNCIFYFLVQNYGSVSAARIMLRFAKVAARFLMNYGFTIGIDDVMPSQRVLSKKEIIVQEGYERAQEKIHDYENGKLEAIPGSTVQETLEAALNQILSNVRESCAQVALKELHFTNKPLIMSLCGSKGSPINIAQMIIILGQQSFGGSRAPDDFYTRSAPYFYHYSKEPNSKGFILNSFYTGLLPFEFLAHARAGRDGVIDSACKTADTGYLQRRLVKCLEDLCVSYDFTVRNSKKSVVQFRFGHDGFDPIKLEVGTAQCLDFDTLLRHIILLNRSQDLAEGTLPVLLNPCEAGVELETLINKDFYGQEACLIEKNNVINYFQKNILPKLTANDDITATISPTLAASFLQTTITRKDIDDFLRQVRRKYIRLNLEPGSPCGAVAAQSVGEPSTQMTLKSFHHAGLASMNITQGVPRLKEIVDGVVKISTPITTVELHVDVDKGDPAAIVTEKYLEKARMMKNIIECTYLGQISSSIIECYSQSSCHIEVNLDMKIIADMGLAGVVTVETVVASILQHDKAKKLVGQDQSSGSVSIHSATKFSVRPITQSRDDLLFDIQSLKLLLPMIPVSGVFTCSRAVINEYKEIGQGSVPLTKYNLLVEGVGLQNILNVSGIDFTHTLSNNIIEVANTLGIEAAVATITNEIKACMDSHGMAVDLRHIRLLADIMCFRGRVLGFTRFGLTKMKADSVIMLASFEKTGEHLFNAALGNKIDETNGVTESIILGKPMSMGTGSFSLLQAPYFDEKTGKTIEYQPKSATRFLGEVLNKQYDEEVDSIVNAFWYDEKIYLTGSEAKAKLLRGKRHANKRPWSRGREKHTSSRSKH